MIDDSLSKVIQQYLDRGFGSMTKNNFEVWIFNYLLQSYFKGLSDNTISRRLQIPESKVKRLRYEAELKNPHDDKFYKDIFYEVLQNRVYKIVDSNRIQFSITDKALRLYLDDMLEKHGSYADSSFNTNIVTLTASDLLLLLADFENKTDLIEIIKKSLKNSDEDLPENTKKIVREGLTAVLKDVGGHFAPKVTDFLSKHFG